jgi:hypothetical protein
MRKGIFIGRTRSPRRSTGFKRILRLAVLAILLAQDVVDHQSRHSIRMSRVKAFEEPKRVSPGTLEGRGRTDSTPENGVGHRQLTRQTLVTDEGEICIMRLSFEGNE